MLTPHVVTSNDDAALVDRTRNLINELPLPESVREQIQKGQLEGNKGQLSKDFEPILNEQNEEPESKKADAKVE